jgi:hypothetical protein
MNLIGHRDDDTRLPVGLKEITDRIYRHIDRMVLRVGEELQRAWVEHRDLYDVWVERDLPFGMDKARRLRKIYLASQHFDEATLARFPAPWQALYAISRLPAPVVRDAVTSGAIHPSMSVRESQEVVRQLTGDDSRPRFTPVDLLAGKLMNHRPDALSADVRRALTGWLGESDPCV